LRINVTYVYHLIIRCPLFMSSARDQMRRLVSYSSYKLAISFLVLFTTSVHHLSTFIIAMRSFYCCITRVVSHFICL